MAWVTSVSGFGSTLNVSVSVPGEALFILRRLLLETGAWTCVKDSDGTTYSSSGAQITHGGSGAGGLNNSYAWMVLQETTGRQLLFQRGTQIYSWKVHYSKASGFVQGSPAATVTPTAVDGQYINAATDTYSNVFGTSGTYRVNAMAQNAVHNTVYSFTLLVRSIGTGAAYGSILFHALDESLSYGADGDPVVLLANTGALLYTGGCSIGNTSSSLRGWQRYGEANAEFGYFSLDYYSNIVPKGATGSPYLTYPTHIDKPPVSRQTGIAPGRKGRMKFIAYVYDSSIASWGDLIEDSEGNVWIVADHVAILGWPGTSTIPLG